MKIDIYSVPYCYKKGKRWALKVYYYDLESLRIDNSDFQLNQIALLPLGAVIENNISIKEINPIYEIITFQDFNCGEIVSLNDLPASIYKSKIDPSIEQSTKFYVIEQDQQVYIFFCYELFRALLCSHNILTQYVLRYDTVYNAIKKAESYTKDGKSHLKLDFNNEFSLKTVKNNGFIRQLLMLMYNPAIKEYWKSIQFSTEDTSEKNHFVFDNLRLVNFTIKCRVKIFENVVLIMDIKSILSGINIPFDHVSISHPKLNQQKKVDGDGKGGGKPRGFDTKIPKEINVNEKEEGSNKEGENTRISAEVMDINLDREFKIERIYKEKKAKGGDNKGKPPSFPKPSLDDLGDFSFGDVGDNEGSTFLTIDRSGIESKFDMSRLPKGLSYFTMAVDWLAKKFELEISYETKYFNNDNQFSEMGDDKRAMMLVKIRGPEIFICEVDTSDGKYISTLVFANVKMEISKFVDDLMNLTAANNGTWPSEFLNINCKSLTLKHPVKLNKGKFGTKEGKIWEDLYIDRFCASLGNLIIKR